MPAPLRDMCHPYNILQIWQLFKECSSLSAYKNCMHYSLSYGLSQGCKNKTSNLDIVDQGLATVSKIRCHWKKLLKF